MFDFLKKSRAVKFLCSACLLCSLGSFVNVNADNPTKIAEAYVQGELGFQSERIVLDDAALDLDGNLSSGKLRWRVDDGSDIDLDDLINLEEDAKLALFLVDSSTNKQVATSGIIDLSDYSGSDPSGPYDLATTEFYDVKSETPGNYEVNSSTPVYKAQKPGVLGVYGFVTTPGETSLISGPNA